MANVPSVTGNAAALKIVTMGRTKLVARLAVRLSFGVPMDGVSVRTGSAISIMIVATAVTRYTA